MKCSSISTTSQL